MRNKRGDLAVTILVFLVMILFAVALYSFAVTNSVTGKKITDIVFIEGAYLDADSFKYGMTSTVEDAFISTYLKFLENENNYMNCDVKFDEVCYFDFLRADLDDRFESLFLEKFGHEYDGEVEAELNDDLFSVVFADMEFTSDVSGYFVNYTTDIGVDVNFVDQGFIGFEKLYNARKCSAGLIDIDLVKECFVGFAGFDVSVSEVDEYFNVVLERGEVRFNFLVD